MTTLWNLPDHRSSATGLADGETIAAAFWTAVRLRTDKVWMREKVRGFWRAWTWARAGEQVREVACGLAALGVQPGTCCSVLANTVVEWVIADLGILSVGGVSSGIYPTDSPEQVQFLSSDSSTVVLFVEDDEQLDKVLAVRAHLPALQWIIVFDTDGLHKFEDSRVISLERLRDIGRAFDADHPDEFDRRLASRGAGDLAILVYTSGTTGRPKGAMHSHGGLMHGARNFNKAHPQSDRDRRMCFLPLCHLAERLLGVYVSIHSGAVLHFVENPETVPENVREIAPTSFFAVPRIWEKLYSSVEISVKEATRLQQSAYRWAIGVGGKVADCVTDGRAVPWHLKLRFHAALWAALGNVRKSLGIHEAHRLFTGAAPIAPDLIRWYLSLGIPMLEGWALTECLLGTFTTPDAIRPGTIGRAMPGVEVEVDPLTGELLLRGRAVFMGYLNQPEKTAETFDARGWLRTGDVGAVDESGFFRITDRMKDIIITAGGKNITPSEIENELKFSPYITDAIVIGDRRPYLTAIVMIDLENVERFAQDHDVPFTNYASLTRATEVVRLIDEEVGKVNGKFARVEQVKKFFLLEKQLSPEDEELTPTMKLKRKLVEKKYLDRIDAMYR
jgi:long-chain acyl-CoA synthetase